MPRFVCSSSHYSDEDGSSCRDVSVARLRWSMWSPELLSSNGSPKRVVDGILVRSMARKGIKEPVDAMTWELEAMVKSRVRVGVSTLQIPPRIRLRLSMRPQPDALRRRAVVGLQRPTAIESCSSRPPPVHTACMPLDDASCYFELYSA